MAPALPLRASRHVPPGVPLELKESGVHGAVVIETGVQVVRSKALGETRLMSAKAVSPEEDEKMTLFAPLGSSLTEGVADISYIYVLLTCAMALWE